MVRFVEDENFLRGMFESGLSFDDGVRELVDNAIDSGAKRIRVEMTAHGKHGLSLFVMDDGAGVPTEIAGRPGLPYVLAFGGRLQRPTLNRRGGSIGRFGFGLSQTITSLAKEHGYAEVWSRNRENEQWRYASYDFDDLMENDFYIPAEKTKSMRWIPVGDYGTMVYIEVEGTEGMRPGAAQTRLLKWMGRVYRHHLVEGVSIEVVATTKSQGSRPKTVRLKDPLALMPGSEEVEVLGMAVPYEVDDIVMDEDGPFGQRIIDPMTGEPARLRFRLSRMPAIEVRKRLGLPLLGTPAQPDKGKFSGDTQLKKWGIGYDGQGFSLLRDGREVDASKTLGIYSKHSDFHYMHGEVDFPVCLDRFFHVQTNKSRYTIDERMGQVLSLHFNKHLIALRRDHRGSIDRFRKAEAARQSASLAEELSKRAAPLLPQPPMDEAAKQAADKMREAAMAEEKQRAIEALSQQVQAANDRAMEARNRGDDGAAEEADTEVRALLDQQEEWFKRIESRWSSRAPTRLDEASLLSMELYAMQDRGDEAHITVNTDTRFHERVYGPVAATPRLRVLLDLMISTLGYAEFMDGKTRPETANRWMRIRQEVSQYAEIFVSAMPPTAEVQGGDLE